MDNGRALSIILSFYTRSSSEVSCSAAVNLITRSNVEWICRLSETGTAGFCL